MSDTVSLPGSHYGGPAVVASPDFATAVLSAIYKDDGGNTSKLNYSYQTGQKGVKSDANILIDTTPGTQSAGLYNEGIVDESTTPGADTLVGASTTQFMIADNADGDVFDVNSNASVSGGAGNDTVNVGSGEYATAYLGAGDNVVNLAVGAGVYLDPSDTPGSDTVNATGGNDFVSVGGVGYDATINFTGSPDPTDNRDTVAGSGGQTINLSGNNAIEISGADEAADTINVVSGSDTIYVDKGASVVATGSFTVVNSNDTTSGLTGLSVAGAGSATIVGGASHGVSYYGTSGDTVVAGSGSATLYGGSGTEYFSAGDSAASVLFKTGNGSDTFVGGTGHDTMSVVGTGSGLFEFSATAGGGTHVIDAFSEARDTIDLSGYTSDTVTSAGSGSSEVTTISLGDGTKITVHGIFHSSDIKFS
jgi:hypothetical protein